MDGIRIVKAEQRREIRVEEKAKDREVYIHRHELSLLRLYIEKYPDDALAILQKFRLQKAA